MTGTSIIGWSHLPFGKHADKDIESMMVEAGAGALKHAGVAPKDVDAIFVGHFNAGFSAQDFPVFAQLRHRSRAALQAGDARRERLRHRLRRRAPGHQGDRRQAGAHRAGDRRRAHDRQRRRRHRPQPLEGELREGRGGYARRLRRRVRPHRRALFPALWRPVRRAGAHRRQEPPQRRRQSVCPDAQGPRLRLLPQRLGQEPAGGGPAQAHRLLAGLRRRGGAGARRPRHRARVRPRRADPQRRAGQRLPADARPRHRAVRRLLAGLGQGARARQARRSTISASSRPTTASPSPS